MAQSSVKVHLLCLSLAFLLSLTPLGFGGWHAARAEDASNTQPCDDPRWYCLDACATLDARNLFDGNDQQWRQERAQRKGEPGACDLPSDTVTLSAVPDPTHSNAPSASTLSTVASPQTPQFTSRNAIYNNVLRHIEVGADNEVYYSYLPRGATLGDETWPTELRSHAHELLAISLILGTSSDRNYRNIAKAALLRHVRLQSADGGYPYALFPGAAVAGNTDRTGSSGSTMPILAYQALKIYGVDRDKAFLNEVYASAKRNLDWWDATRKEGDFYFWRNYWESVRDNPDLSTWNAAGGAEKQYAIDLQCYMYRYLTDVAKMAAILGDKQGAAGYTDKANKLADAIQKYMWNGSAFFGIRRDNHQQIETYDIGTLLPLWAGFATQSQAESIMNIYRTRFHTSYGIPSLAINAHGFTGDHWLGGTWPEFNYLIVEGMKAYGFNADAAEVIKSSRAVYATYGPSEFYNPFSGQPAGFQNYIWGNLMAMPGM